MPQPKMDAIRKVIAQGHEKWGYIQGYDDFLIRSMRRLVKKSRKLSKAEFKDYFGVNP